MLTVILCCFLPPQHLALKTDDIISTLRKMRSAGEIGGFDFMPRPSDGYYRKLPARCAVVVAYAGHCLRIALLVLQMSTRVHSPGLLRCFVYACSCLAGSHRSMRCNAGSVLLGVRHQLGGPSSRPAPDE